MKAASINEIKQELGTVSQSRLLALCLRLAKFKKDNKELLTYLLFDEQDEKGYVLSVKNEMDEQFAAINKSNVYFAKKSLRKILRTAAKHSRYIASKEAEVELLLHFCTQLLESGLQVKKNTVLSNMYAAQVKKISKLIGVLHEDLQYDYLKTLNNLQLK